MKKILKITVILLIILILQTQINFCNAATEEGEQKEKVSIIDEDKITGGIYDPGEIGEQESFKEKVNIVTGVIRNIGIVVSLVALMFIGLRTMIGSAEEKSEYKKALPGYIIGVLLVMAMTALPSIISEMVN